MSGVVPSLCARLGRWSVNLVLLLLVFVLLVFTLIPVGIRWGVAHWFEQQGMDAQLQHVSLAPVVGRIEVAGFQASRDGEVVLALDEFVLDVDILPLLDSRVEVSEIEVSGLFLATHKVDKTFSVAGLDLLKLASGSSVATDSSEVTEEPSLAQTPMHIAVEQLTLSGLKVCASAFENEVALSNLCVSLAQLNNQQPMTVRLAEGVQVAIPGSVNLRGFSVDDGLQALHIFGWREFQMAGLELEADALRLESLNVNALSMMERRAQSPLVKEQPNHFQMAEMQLEQLDVDLSGLLTLDAEKLSLRGMDALLLRDSEKLLPLQRRVNHLMTAVESVLPVSRVESSAASPVSPDAEASPGQSPVVSLGQFTVGGSRLVYVDTQVQPAVSQRLEDIRVSLGPLNTSNADQLSALNVAMDLNEFSKLSLQGGLKPFTQKLNMDLELAIEAYEPLAISPYIERALQYKIQRGQLNNNISIVIENDQLDVKSELVLEKFYLKDLEPEELAPGEKSQTIPIATAMNLLRDGDDRIVIELPVTGDIADPSFSLSQILGVVFQKALTQAVVNYYTPFGLVSLASSLADAATELRFEPLDYAAGEQALNDNDAKRLRKLGQLLLAKRQLSLSFCPKVTGLDALKVLNTNKAPEGGVALTVEQTQEVKRVGVARGVAIKTLLMADGVAASQVILCQPEVDLNNMTAPQVDISM